jgi:phosphate transport system protein
MTHLETELNDLKSNLIEMWSLVISQIDKSRKALVGFDKDLAHDISANEKRVDAFELKINMDCENILALFNPVANDLRFVLSVLKINYNLERIGDYAKGISSIVRDTCQPFDAKDLEESRVEEMYAVALKMMSDALESFSTENNQLARSIFVNDEVLDKVNKNANKTIASFIERNPQSINDSLQLLTVIRKLERVGDQTKNIAEEIIFYMEAKVLKHTKKKHLQ